MRNATFDAVPDVIRQLPRDFLRREQVFYVGIIAPVIELPLWRLIKSFYSLQRSSFIVPLKKIQVKKSV